jgi:RNA polymerase sigma-70 factor (ECF subfamily)
MPPPRPDSLTLSPPASRSAWPAASATEWFAAEVQPHEADLRSFLRGRLPSPHDVDDVVQDSFVRMLQRHPRTQFASTRGYLFAVARHAVCRLFRRRRIYSDVPVHELPAWQLVAPASDPARAAGKADGDDAVAGAIAALPARCREVVKLRLICGLPHAEIAARLGISESTVRVQIARGVRKCARHLRGGGGEVVR